MREKTHRTQQTSVARGNDLSPLARFPLPPIQLHPYSTLLRRQRNHRPAEAGSSGWAVPISHAQLIVSPVLVPRLGLEQKNVLPTRLAHQCGARWAPTQCQLEGAARRGSRLERLLSKTPFRPHLRHQARRQRYRCHTRVSREEQTAVSAEATACFLRSMQLRLLRPLLPEPISSSVTAHLPTHTSGTWSKNGKPHWRWRSCRMLNPSV